MQVRGQAALRFDGGEVLHVEPDRPAQVLPEPVHQLREVDRVPGRGPVVVGARVDRRAVGRVHPPVGAAGQRQEQRRTDQPSVRSLVRAADGARGDGLPRQVRHVLAATGGPGPPPPGLQVAVYSGLGELRSDLPDRVIDVGGVLPGTVQLGAGRLQVSAGRGQLLLPTGRGRRVRDRLGGEVPAFPALRHPQQLRPPRARLTLARDRRPARDVHDLRVPGSRVDPAHRHRPGTHPVLRRQRPQDVASSTGGTRTAGASSSALGAASAGATAAVAVSSSPLLRGTGTSWARPMTSYDRKPLPHNRSRARHVSCCCALVSVVVR